MDMTVDKQKFPIMFDRHLRRLLVVGTCPGWKITRHAVCYIHPYVDSGFVAGRSLWHPFEEHGEVNFDAY